MKLRLQGNSVRLRLTRSEVERLREPDPVRAGFREGAITVSMSTDVAQAWAGSDEVGFYAQSGALAISMEKDFRCLTRPPEEQERDAYPHPGQRS